MLVWSRDYRTKALVGVLLTLVAWFLIWQLFWGNLFDGVTGRIHEYGNQSPPLLPPEEHEEGPEEALARTSFVEIASITPIEGVFDLSPIKALCDAQHIWTGDVVFDTVAEGGIGNVRQEVLASMRYAIDAGAGLILPVIKVRGDDLVTLDTGVVADTGYMFDRDAFISRMKIACPQMTLYENVQHLESVGPVLTTVTAPRDMSQDEGTVFSVKPDLADGSAFADNFGQVLPFRKDVERLAAAAIYELSRRFNLHIDPSSGLTNGSYLSVHLRTATDAAAMGWPGYEKQVPRYITLAKDLSLSVIYVASGDAESAKKFAAYCAKLRPPIYVVSKQDLLSAADLEYLDTLAWDQQALVDYSVLLKGSYFAGIAASSFAANVAVRRRVLSKSGTCGEDKTPPGVAFKDELSELMGNEHTVWMDAMWP